MSRAIQTTWWQGKATFMIVFALAVAVLLASPFVAWADDAEEGAGEAATVENAVVADAQSDAAFSEVGPAPEPEPKAEAEPTPEPVTEPEPKAEPEPTTAVVNEQPLAAEDNEPQPGQPEAPAEDEGVSELPSATSGPTSAEPAEGAGPEPLENDMASESDVESATNNSSETATDEGMDDDPLAGTAEESAIALDRKVEGLTDDYAGPMAEGDGAPTEELNAAEVLSELRVQGSAGNASVLKTQDVPATGLVDFTVQKANSTWILDASNVLWDFSDWSNPRKVTASVKDYTVRQEYNGAKLWTNVLQLVLTTNGVLWDYSGDEPVLMLTGVAEIFQLSSYYSANAVLMTDGSLYMWARTDKTPKKVLSDVVGFLEPEYGRYYVITKDKSLLTWSLGDGEDVAPTQILENVLEVQNGEALTCDGDLYIWQSSQSGYSEPQRVLTNVKKFNGSLAVCKDATLWHVVYGSDPVQIMSGVKEAIDDTFALKTDGTLWHWDYEDSVATTPVCVMSNVTSLHTAYAYSDLSIAVALKKDGSLWSVINDNPILMASHIVKVFVSGARDGKNNDNSIRCWAISDTGSFYVWGNLNAYGAPSQGVFGFDNPQQILTDVVNVATGDDMTAAVTSDGSLYVWGGNSNGELGDGTTIARYAPTKIMDGVLKVVISDTGESNSSYCAALKADGSLWTWGKEYKDYFDSRLGNGDAGSSLVPVKILEGVKDVALSELGGFALKNDASLWAWGHVYPGDGQERVSYASPVKIMEGIASMALSSGGDYGVIKVDGSLWMWGPNHYGAVGNGERNNRWKADDIVLAPLKVLDKVRQIVFGGYDVTYAVTQSNELYSWGTANRYSHALEGSEVTLLPSKIDEDVLSISVSGTGRSYVVFRVDGSISAHVMNCSTGNYIVSDESDALVELLLDVAQVALETSYYSGAQAFLKSDGTLLMCGSNSLGLLGLGWATWQTTPLLFTGSGKFNIDSIQVSLPSSATAYTGKAITPAVSVVDVGGKLQSGKDFRVTYKNNVNVGTATVTLTGIGSYVGSISKTFTITPLSIAKATVSGIAARTYTGKAQGQNPTVKVGGLTATRALAYKNNVNAGTATVTITGTGNYTGSIAKTFKITPLSIVKAAVSGLKDKTYTGEAITQALSVALSGYAPTFKVAYKNNVNAGTATVTITGTGNFAGSIAKTFKINPAKLAASGVKFAKATLAYTGKAVKPKVTVKYGGKTLKAGADYTVAYAKNPKAVGTYKVKIVGKGNYAGSASKAYVVNPKATAVTKTRAYDARVGGGIEVSWRKVPAQIDGYEVWLSTSKKFPSSGLKKQQFAATSAVGKKASFKGQGLKKGVQYYVKIRTYKKAGGKTYLSAWSKAKGVKTKKSA